MLDSSQCDALAPVLLLVTAFLPVSAPAQSTRSLRFFGNGMSDIDRVKICIDAPPVPADVGGNFTLEFWMKAGTADNGAGTCGAGGDGWIIGNIIFDRDVYNDGDFGDYGVALFENGIGFGVAVGSSSNTICGSSDVDDGVWHHVAVTRDTSSGDLELFVDGVLGCVRHGPTGNASYRDGRATTFPADPFLVIGAEKHDAGRVVPVVQRLPRRGAALEASSATPRTSRRRRPSSPPTRAPSRSTTSRTGPRATARPGRASSTARAPRAGRATGRAASAARRPDRSSPPTCRRSGARPAATA